MLEINPYLSDNREAGLAICQAPAISGYDASVVCIAVVSCLNEVGNLILLAFYGKENCFFTGMIGCFDVRSFYKESES